MLSNHREWLRDVCCNTLTVQRPASGKVNVPYPVRRLSYVLSGGVLIETTFLTMPVSSGPSIAQFSFTTAKVLVDNRLDII